MKGRKIAWRAFLWIMVLGTAALIYFFSAQTGEESGGLSAKVTLTLARFLKPGFDLLSAGERRAFLTRVEFYIRKGAHFSEYAFLAFWLCLLLRRYAVRWSGFLAWAAATLYAAADELHQTFVAGRAGMARDIAIDSLGALAGVLIAWGLSRLIGRKKR